MESINIICLLWKGNFRGRDYTESDVQTLRWNIDRYIDRPYKFYCLTNDMSANVPAEKIQLLNNWSGWWSKVELFRPDLPPGRTLYMDLDSHIVNNMQPILDYEGDLVMFNSNKPSRLWYELQDDGWLYRYQAATMLFDPGALSWIYDKFATSPERFMFKYRSEQDMYGDWIPDQPTFPDHWMMKLESLKKKTAVPEGVIIVTGRPKNDSFRNPSFAPWFKELI